MRCPGDNARSNLSYRFCVVAALLLLPSFAPAAAPSFSRDVLPILSDNCFYCHGPDENHRKAKLRLDTHEGMLRVVTPGKSAASELIRRVTSDDTDEVMPPPRSNRTRRLNSGQCGG